MFGASPPKLARALSLVISTVLSLLVMEGGLQIYYRLTMDSWLWSFNAFHATYIDEVPDRRRYSLRRGFSDDRMGVSINDRGFRTAVSYAEPNHSDPVIAMIGDSKPFGSGVRDNETYPFLLDQLLVSTALPIRTVNSGVPSYNTRQAIDRFSLDVLPTFNVKVVIFHAAFNDVSLLTYYREQWNADRTWAEMRYKGYRPPLTFIQRSATLYFASRALSSQNDESPADRARAVVYEKYPDDVMIANLKSELDSFLSACEEKSILVVLLPIDPFYYQTSNTEKNEILPLWVKNKQYVEIWKDTIRRYDDLLINMSKTHKSVYFFDTRAIIDSHDRGDLFVDAVHYSAKGNKVVAEALFEFLKEKGLVGH